MKEKETEEREGKGEQTGEYMGAIIQLSVIGQPNCPSINQANQIIVSTFYHTVDNDTTRHGCVCAARQEKSHTDIIV